MEKDLSRNLDAEGYQDLRYEDLKTTVIHFKGKDLDQISSSAQKGGHARALIGGLWGTFSFSDLNDIKTGVTQAKTASKLLKGKLPLADVKPVQENIKVLTSSDPRLVSLKEKKALLEKYNNLALSYEGIQSTDAVYQEIIREKYFFNNQGSAIYQEQILTGIRLVLTGKKDGITQRTSVAFGGSPHFEALLGQDESVEQKIKETLDLLNAEPVKAGNYTVILDPECTGVFVHEAFGHLSESDFLANNPRLQQELVLGRTFGRDFLNIIDDATIKDVPGFFNYDDEGVQGQKTILIKDGKLNDRLHSRETAGRLNEKPTGNARAMNYTHTPIVRMTTTFIDKGPHSFDEMVASIDDGLYLLGAAGGQTSGEFFTFGTQAGYKIKNGKIDKMIRDANLSGNLFQTLHNIEMIANDLVLSKQGGCGKGSQILMDVGTGSPHVKIADMAIGGK